MSYKVNGTRPTDIRTVAYSSDAGDQEKPWHLADHCNSSEADENELIALHNQMSIDEIDALITDDTGMTLTEIEEFIHNVLSMSGNAIGKVEQSDLFCPSAAVTELFADFVRLGCHPKEGCKSLWLSQADTENMIAFIPEKAWSISNASTITSFQDIRWSEDTAQLSALLRERERRRARLSEA